MTAYPARSPDRPTRTDPTDPPVRARYAHGSTRTVRGGVLVRAHHGDDGAWTTGRGTSRIHGAGIDETRDPLDYVRDVETRETPGPAGLRGWSGSPGARGRRPRPAHARYM